MIRVFLIILFIFISYSSANAVSGVADKYEVTMKKVELCQSSQCQAPTEVASGTQAVNIASLNAGAEAAKFGSTSGLPIGKSYSHLRVTLNLSLIHI